jgi:sugar O-acyltransferase (sialic acid O-acetyltransferase NeuD family)
MNANQLSPGVVILGAGLHAKLVIEFLEMDGQHPIAVLDDNPRKHGTRVKGVPVMGPISLLPEMKRQEIVIGVVLGFGNIQLRAKRTELFRWASELGVDILRVVHPSAVFASSATVSRGFFAGPHAVVNTDTQLGDDVTIYTGSTIDHDNVIGDHVFFSSGVHTAGLVRIESGVYIGPGAVIGSQCRIGAGSIVGAGAVVIEDVPPGCLVAGVPARKLKSVEEWEQERS